MFALYTTTNNNDNARGRFGHRGHGMRHHGHYHGRTTGGAARLAYVEAKRTAVAAALAAGLPEPRRIRLAALDAHLAAKAANIKSRLGTGGGHAQPGCAPSAATAAAAEVRKAAVDHELTGLSGALAAPALTDDECLRLAFVHLELSREAAAALASASCDGGGDDDFAGKGMHHHHGKGHGKGKGGKGKGGKDHGKGGKGKGMRHCVGLMAPLFGEGHRAEARVAERLAFVEAKLQAAVSGRALPAGKAERLEHKRNILAAHLAELQDRRPKDPKDTLPKDTTKADGAEDDAGAKPTPGCEAKPECSAGSGAADRGGFCGFGRPEHHFHEHHHHYHHHEGHGKGHGGKGDGMGKGGKGKRHGGKGGFFGSGMN